MRIYLEGKEQPDSYYEELALSPPAEDESMVDYSERTFDKKFAIIFNYGEKHSDLISEHIRNCVSPLIELVGLPPLGLEITIFIGNYGWTPLGIHKDQQGENVLHFHLGPGGKKMYTWDEDIYKELTGGKSNNKDIESILDHSKEYPFEAGDLYYMPWFKNHVGYTGELSVGVTLWFNNPTKRAYASQMLESIKHQFFKKAYAYIPNQMNYLESDDAFDDVVSVLQLDEEMYNLPFKDVLKQTQEDFKYCLMSNAGWQNVPLSLEKKKGYEVNEYESLAGKTVTSKNPFQILYKKNDGQLLVYVRGSKIKIKYFKELVEIIDRINNYNVINIDELLTSFSEGFPPEAGLYFLSLLINKRGIDLIEV